MRSDKNTMKNMLFQEVEKFERLYGKKKIILYGAGSAGRFICAALKVYGFDILYFVDSDIKKQGCKYMGLEVKSPYDLMNENLEKKMVVLALSASDEAKKELQGMGFSEKVHYCSIGDIECQNKADIFDPFLGYSRMDDLEGFKEFGSAGADIKIITLGGSTTDFSMSKINSWPFYLQKKCWGKKCQVINGGIGGYYSGQELLKLLRDGILLKPDIVISYSGINDALSLGHVSGHPLVSMYLKNTLEKLPVKNIGYGCKNSLSSSDIWLMNMRMMYALCREFGIKFYSFLQPAAYIGNYNFTEKEKEVIDYIYGCDYSERVNQFYNKTKEIIKEYSYIYDMTSVFSGMSGIYYDSCHCNEEGNMMIADYIFKIVSKNF